jgi:hypothetical protein
MENDSNSSAALEADVAGRFDILPNFFRSASAAPELLERLRQIVDHLVENESCAARNGRRRCGGDDSD